MEPVFLVKNYLFQENRVFSDSGSALGFFMSKNVKNGETGFTTLPRFDLSIHTKEQVPFSPSMASRD